MQAIEKDTSCMSTVLAVEKGYTLHIHTACGGNGYTLMPTLLLVERKHTVGGKMDSHSHPHS
jgi:hypothetical protein